MDKAVVYARYSSHNQNEMSIEGQVKAAEEYADRNGLVIIRTYEDRAKSGTNDKRPGFQKMLEDCKKHEFQVIIVWKVDRFGRNKEEITFNKYKCKKEGVRVVYVAESIGEGNEAVILESVLEGMAEYYSKQLSTNVKRGQAIAKAKGHWHGGTIPYGFRVVEKKLVPDPLMARSVENIFAQYAEGKTLTEIGEAAGKSRSSVFNILRNENYIGNIISIDLWNRVQKRIKEKGIRRQTKEEHAREYILTSKLYCKCGCKMVGTYGYNHNYKYYCCSSKKKKGTCDTKYLNKADTENIILSTIYNELKDSERIVEGVWNAYLAYKEQDCSSQIPLERIRMAEKGIENIMKAVEQGMDYSLVRERLEALQRDKNEAERELERNSRLYKVELNREEIRKYLSESLKMKDPIALLEKYVNRINLTDEGFEVLLNISPDLRINSIWPGRIEIKAKKESPCN